MNVVNNLTTKLPKIQPVLLAGGSGTRLWPLSRKSYPKQFSTLHGEKTLFQQSAMRLTPSDQIEFLAHITLTNSDFRFIIGEQMQSIGIDPGYILIEPEVKNTAPAILAASLFAQAKDNDAILLVVPSDHVIPDTVAFHAAVKTGLDHVQAGKMVTFGISPTHAVTGYGYLELADDKLDKTGTSSVARFVEKPEYSRAIQMLEAGNYLWNAGIFLFKAVDMIAAFNTYAPGTLELTKNAVETAEPDLGFLRLNPDFWKELENISIDYAIMEKTENLVAVPFSSKWSDLGDWDAVWAESNKDISGVATCEDAHAIDCSDTLLRSESPNQQIVGIGLDNIIAVAMPDAVLIVKKDRAQDVKQAVQLLKANKVRQAETFPKDYRPWGWFESLALFEGFQVKRIHVKPGAALSLQKHRYRSEHWIVVEGTAKVTVNDEVKLLTAGQSVYIPVGAIHRMENPATMPMVLIEVQTGTYFGEDDIIRYSDLYARS